MGKKTSFWVGVLIGFIVMVIMSPLPVFGPIIGGLVAGALVGGGPWNSAKAGFAAGIFGALAIGILLLIGGTLAFGMFGLLAGLAGGAALIVLALYNGILGFIGGVFGGILTK